MRCDCEVYDASDVLHGIIADAELLA